MAREGGEGRMAPGLEGIAEGANNQARPADVGAVLPERRPDCRARKHSHGNGLHVREREGVPLPSARNGDAQEPPDPTGQNLFGPWVYALEPVADSDTGAAG